MAHRPSIKRYQRGCRCHDCRAINRERLVRWRQRRRNQAGATVRCLICDGLFLSEASRNWHEAVMHRSDALDGAA